MLCTAELDMANSVTPDDIDVFLDNAAWAICSTYHRVGTASPGAAILDVTYSSTFRPWLTGTKLENKGNHRPIVAISARMPNVLTTITRSEIKYYWLIKVSSAKQSPHMAKSHGLSLQFIRMELSGFNAERKRNDLVSGEYNHLQMIFFKLGKIYKVWPLIFLLLSHKSYASLIVILSLHLSWPPGSWRLIFFVNFFPYQRFFSAWFSRLTASFMGASVIGHGITVGNIAC